MTLIEINLNRKPVYHESGCHNNDDDDVDDDDDDNDDVDDGDDNQ